MGVRVVRFFDAPLLTHLPDAVAETYVDGAFGGEQRSERFAPFVDAVILVAHHLRHDAAPGVAGLHLHVGHAGDCGRAALYGHLQPVRVRAADNLAVLKHGDGAAQVEIGPQRLRIVFQAVAMGSGLGAHPPFKLVRANVPQFQHWDYSPWP